MKGQKLNKLTIFIVFSLVVGIAFTARIMGLNDTSAIESSTVTMVESFDYTRDRQQYETTYATMVEPFDYTRDRDQYWQSTAPDGYLQNNDYIGGLLAFYACTRGNVQSACDALYDNSQDSDYTGGLLDFYACTRGNVQSACNALYDHSHDSDYTGGLLDFYACTRGNVQSACDALYTTPNNS